VGDASAAAAVKTADRMVLAVVVMVGVGQQWPRVLMIQYRVFHETACRPVID
jgi:hypothetical protein